MKKILSLISVLTLGTTTITQVTACSSNTLLEITNDDIYDEPDSTGKIDKIAFFFIYELPDKEKSQYPISKFYPHWQWNLKNRKKIIGYNSAGMGGLEPEYWKLTLEKTQTKGVFVAEYEKSNQPIENAQF